MTTPDPSAHDQRHIPRVPSGRHGSQARNLLPHGAVDHPDIRELLRNSSVHFGGNDATVAHLLDVNTRNLMSGDPRMRSNHGIALYDPLNHFTEGDASRLAHGLLGTRHHASAQARDLYTSAIHDLGYRFDEHGHIHKVPGREADFSAAMKNPAFRAHIAVENDRAAYQQRERHHDVDAGGGKLNTSASLNTAASGGLRTGLDVSRSSPGRGGLHMLMPTH
jgi:hypothetical protein